MIDTAMVAIHLVFGAIWIGAVSFVTLAILPLARDGDLDRAAFEGSLGWLVRISRIGALLMLISGSHLMGTGGYFDTDYLFGEPRGLAVLAMVVLWLGLIVVIEVSTKRMRSGLDAGLLRDPANDGMTWFYLATLIGVALFVIGAMLTTGYV